VSADNRWMRTSTLRRLGVFGGTFDPIHVGHLIAASEVLHSFDLDGVLFVPAGRPWQKAEYSDPEDRHLMTVLATSSHPHFSTSRIEIDRPGPTYTVDTLTRIHEFHGPDVHLFFIVGADALANLGTWRDIELLGDLCEIVAVTRPGSPLGVPLDPSWPRVHRCETSGVDISSSEIRARVATGRPIDWLVPDDVAEYIRTHHLYLDVGASRGA
jgi:nicotinate-nucleotide adenylyltransferase